MGTQFDPDATTNLLNAAKNGIDFDVKAALKKNADPNARDEDGLTALMHVVGWQQHHPLEAWERENNLLLDAEDVYDAEHVDKDENPQAAQEGRKAADDVWQKDVITALLKAGARVSEKYNGNTVVVMARAYNCSPVILSTLETAYREETRKAHRDLAGEVLTPYEKQQNTQPLLRALHALDLEAVLQVIAEGFDPKVTGDDPETPYYGYPPLAYILTLDIGKERIADTAKKFITGTRGYENDEQRERGRILEAVITKATDGDEGAIEALKQIGFFYTGFLVPEEAGPDGVAYGVSQKSEMVDALLKTGPGILVPYQGKMPSAIAREHGCGADIIAALDKAETAHTRNRTQRPARDRNQGPAARPS